MAILTIAPIVGIASGVLLEGGMEVYRQLQTGEPIDWPRVIVRAAGGGLKGGICSIGGGAVFVGVGTGTIGAVENCVCNFMQGDFSAESMRDAAISGGIEGLTTGTLHWIGGKISGKGKVKKLDNSRKSQIRSLTKAEAAETYGGAKDPNWRPGGAKVTKSTGKFLTPADLNKKMADALSGKDILFKNKNQALEFISKKFPNLRQEIAGSRGSEGWHFDCHPISGNGSEPIEHINLYSKSMKFRVHIMWEE